ncbi:MAG: hypothetical protein P8L31_04090 [Pseudomonadales bacterium]|nr:hypothetical protein [Pseudomonadales bacterium]
MGNTMITRLVIVMCGFAFGCAEPDLTSPSPSSSPTRSPSYNTSVSARTPFALAHIKLSQSVPQDAKVFVYLRPIGQRMPLAVQQYSPQDLPVNLAFGFPKEDVYPLEIVARVSLTGSVNAHPGDLEAISQRLEQSSNVHEVQLVLGTQSKNSSSRIQVIIEVPDGFDHTDHSKVYIFAKAIGDEEGLPIAVRVFPSRELPSVVYLSDQHSMLKMNPLSKHGTVLVQARLSVSGNTTPHVEDIESTFQEVAVPTTDPVHLKLMHAASTNQ